MGKNSSPFDDNALLALQYVAQAACSDGIKEFVFSLELAVQNLLHGVAENGIDHATYRELSSLFRRVGVVAATLLPDHYDREMIEATFGAIQQLLTLWKTPPARRNAVPSERAFDPHACIRQFHDDLKQMRRAHAAERLRLIDAQRAAALARRDEDSRKVVIPWPAPGMRQRRCPTDPVIADEVSKHFAAAADAHDVESLARAVSLAFRALERGHHSGQITPTLRLRLLHTMAAAENTAKRTLPSPLYFDRAQHAFLAAFGLILQWAHPPGLRARPEASLEISKLVVRAVGNELDSLCVEAELDRLAPPGTATGNAVDASTSGGVGSHG